MGMRGYWRSGSEEDLILSLNLGKGRDRRVKLAGGKERDLKASWTVLA